MTDELIRDSRGMSDANRRNDAIFNFMLSSAAQEVVDRAIDAIDAGTADIPELEVRAFARHLFLKAIWDKITELLRADAQKYRKIEKEEEDEEIKSDG